MMSNHRLGFATVLLIVQFFCLALLFPCRCHAGTRTEGNYTIDITMQPDPVQDGHEATFRLRVTLDNGEDAGGDFSQLSLNIDGVSMQPLLEYDPETGVFTGTYRLNIAPGDQPGDKKRVTVEYEHKDTGGGSTRPGVWGVHNSEADPNQKKWRLTIANPFYFDAIPPRDWSKDLAFAVLFAALGAMATAAVFMLIRRRPT